MAIHIRTFSGEQPRIAPRLLPDTAATVSRNARLTRGDLDPMRAAEIRFVATDDCGTFYKDGANWLTFPNALTSVVTGPVTTKRLYMTSPDWAPKMLVNGVEYALALPAPATPPVLSRNGTLNEATKELVLFAYTFVTGFGEESQLSPPAGIYWSSNCTIALAQMAAPPAGRNITRKRIYRSQTTAGGETEFMFVGEIAGTAVAYTHDISAAPLQEAIVSRDYDPPPAGLVGLTAMPNGIMAGFINKEVLFSEPYQPHAWPAKYRLAVQDTIVALASFGTSLAVLTNGTPYIIQGLHPEAMSMEKSEQAFPCLAALGVVDMGYAAIYPSTDGLVELSQAGAKLLSAGLWARQEWELMNPRGFRAAAFAGRYVFSHPQGPQSVRQTGIVDARGDAPFFYRSDTSAENFVSDLATGDLHYLDADKRTIAEFDSSYSGTRMSVLWASKPFYSGRPVRLGAAFVEASTTIAGSEARVYGDGALIATIPHTRFNRVARLPSGQWNTIQVEIEGRSTVNRVSIGQMPDEVRV